MNSRDVVVKTNRYYDSVFLMTVTQRLAKQPGVEDAAAVMGSAGNRRTLVRMGFAEKALENAGPNDLIVALQGDGKSVARLLEDIEQWLVRPNSLLGVARALSLDEAWARQNTSNLVVISVPGEYAAKEAHSALEHGMNVFLFSDHVAIEDEIALKRKASDKGLLVMGPDCGTAIIAGTGIGFANVVRRGPIGVVASSGTGLQEITCLIHRAGSGISHGLGTGSRDLSDAVSGLSTLAAIEALEQDPTTAAIAVVSKPPGLNTLGRIVDRLNRCKKPVCACFLGLEAITKADFEICMTLDQAAASSLKLANAKIAPPATHAQDVALAHRECERMSPNQKYVRGFFAGGTFCYQAQQIMRNGGIVVHSNAPLKGMLKLEKPTESVEHTLVDMGADEFTAGIPHPMIDATQRRTRILTEAQDLQVGVLLLDFILGYNASANPAGDLVEAISKAKRRFERAGQHLCVVASVCGTDKDPQDLREQEQMLRDAGVVVFPSSAHASLFAREIVSRRARM